MNSQSRTSTPTTDESVHIIETNNQAAEAPVDEIKPWYKQFWPWFLFGLPGIVVVAGITTVFIAVKGADSVVSDSYYKEGLAINAIVADINKAKDMNLTADIGIDGSVWQVQLSADEAIGVDHLAVELHHPADSKKDISFTLINAGNQIYRGTLSDIDMNRWYIDIYPRTIGATADSWRLKGEIDVSNRTTRLKNR